MRHGTSTPTTPDERDVVTVDTDAIRARLEAQRDRLLARLNEAGEQGQGELTATHGIGETEHVVLGVEREIAAAVESNAREALEDIAAALARLDDGSYGLCRTCRLPIAPERLEAMPETRWCVACQSEQHRRR
jgi:RNA polymerase-binding transcription factor DksA